MQMNDDVFVEKKPKNKTRLIKHQTKAINVQCCIKLCEYSSKTYRFGVTLSEAKCLINPITRHAYTQFSFYTI